ncbi:MAG: hypothetical protein AAB910_02515, partial [Patescibacteria group bacterium]
TQHVDRDANIIFGMGYDEVGELKKGEIKVTVIATGFTGGFQPTHPTIANQASRASAADISFFGGDSARAQQTRSEQPPFSAPQPSQSQNLPPQQPARDIITDPSAAEDYDLDIPAFIRRKMK